MGLQINDILTQQIGQYKAAGKQTVPAYQKERLERFEQKETVKPYYIKNPLNYAIIHTYKLHIVFKDNQARTYIALVAQTTYNAFKQGYPPVFDYGKAFNSLVEMVKVKYYGKYKCARIYECTGLESKEILKWELGQEKPALHPFTGELFTEVHLDLTKLPDYGKPKM